METLFNLYLQKNKNQKILCNTHRRDIIKKQSPIMLLK